MNGFIVFFYLLILLFFIFIFMKKILSNTEISNLINSDIFENRLFLLSLTVLIFCYFIFSNYIYREIFFFGLIPWLLKNNNNSNNNLPTLLLSLICFKFIITTLIVFIDVNNIIPNFKLVLGFLKHSIDFFIIFPLTIIMLISFYYFFRTKLIS